jgi:hypothetical protein
MSLAVALWETAPVAIVSVFGAGLVLAPDAGALKVTLPPSTASTALFAVTVNLSGVVKAVFMNVDWPSPPDFVSANPCDSNYLVNEQDELIRYGIITGGIYSDDITYADEDARMESNSTLLKLSCFPWVVYKDLDHHNATQVLTPTAQSSGQGGDSKLVGDGNGYVGNEAATLYSSMWDMQELNHQPRAPHGIELRRRIAENPSSSRCKWSQTACRGNCRSVIVIGDKFIAIKIDAPPWFKSHAIRIHPVVGSRFVPYRSGARMSLYCKNINGRAKKPMIYKRASPYSRISNFTKMSWESQRLIKAMEVAEILKVSRKRLYNLRWRDEIPALGLKNVKAFNWRIGTIADNPMLLHRTSILAGKVIPPTAFKS